MDLSAIWAKAQGEPAVWRYRQRGTELWHYVSKPDPLFLGAELWEHEPLYATPDPAALQRFADAVRAEERARCSVLTDDMLRYAMAAIGTGSPAEAERFRAFWLHAIAARDSAPSGAM